MNSSEMCFAPAFHLLILLSCFRLREDYIQKYGPLAPDSDYDAQDPYSMTVKDDVMHLEDQDLKLRNDYLTLPLLCYAELKDPNNLCPLLLPYSAVWEAMLVKQDHACCKYVLRFLQCNLLMCVLLGDSGLLSNLPEVLPPCLSLIQHGQIRCLLAQKMRAMGSALYWQDWSTLLYSL